MTQSHMAQVYREDVTLVSLGVTFAEHQKNENWLKVVLSVLQQLHRNEIGLGDVVFQSCEFDEHYKHEKCQVSGSCNRSFFDALHFLFLALMAGLLISRSHIKDTCTQRFSQPAGCHRLRQAISIADVSIQRGESPFDPSTSSSQSSRLSQMSCFRADKSIAKRLFSTCLVFGETKCAKRLSQAVNQTCPIAAEAVSSH